MEEFLAVEELVIVLLLVATLVAVVARRVRLPYTVTLVVVGLFISIASPLDLNVTPELILFLFIPPLVYEAAFHLNYRLLRENLLPVLILAVPGVLVTTLVVGSIVSAGTQMAVSLAMVFGALIAAVDPVAVVALFRDLGVPRRLAAAVEGESLFNDGTAVVIFQIAVAAATTGAFNPAQGLVDFFVVALGGLAIGLVLGWVSAQILARIDNDLVETTLTVILAYGAYLLGEQLHVSGVLAVVGAGLISGTIGLQGVSPTTKIMLWNMWDFFGFLANSLVFLLIGLEVDLSLLWGNLWAIVVAVIAVLLSRVVVVYILPWFIKLVRGQYFFPPKWRTVFFWGSLRGALSLALVLSLPFDLPQRDTLVAMAFGVVLFTLLAQGTTIQFLLQRMGLTEKSPAEESRERQLGRLYASQAGLAHLESLYQNGLLTEKIWLALHTDYEQARERMSTELQQLFVEHAELEREMLLQARLEALRAERVALGDALRRGLIADDIYEKLREELDYRLEAVEMIRDAVHES